MQLGRIEITIDTIIEQAKASGDIRVESPESMVRMGLQSSHPSTIRTTRAIMTTTRIIIGKRRGITSAVGIMLE